MSTPLSTFLINRFVLVGTTPQELILDLGRFNPEGFFSLHGKGVGSSGAGTITVTFQVSNNGGASYVTPTPAPSAIMSGLGQASEIFASFSTPPCGTLKLIFTPTDDVSADFWICMI